jgi:hypothetical protein
MHPDEELARLADLRARAWAVICDGQELVRETRRALAQAAVLVRQTRETLDAWPVAHGRPGNGPGWPP